MLKSLRIENFRGFQSFELQKLGRINLLVGENNSGKTSILEALQLLFCSSDNLEPISDLMLNRSEYSWNERNKNNPLLSINRLFHKHEIEVGSHFLIQSVAKNLSSSSLSVSIDCESEEQMSFVDSEFNEVTDLFLVLHWNRFKDQEVVKIPLLFNDGVSMDYLRRVRLGKGEPLIKSEFIRSSSLTTTKMMELFDQVVLTPEEGLVYKALQSIEPRIERIASINFERHRYLGEHGGFIVRLSGTDQRVPVGSMGDGIWRMLGLSLAVVCTKGGALLVDEIDTGLHFTTMTNMWRMLWETAKQSNVQVFATTHSRDCWESLAELIETEKISENEVVIHRIEKGKSKSVLFDADQIVIAAERGIEVR